MSFDPDKPYNDVPLLPPKAELDCDIAPQKSFMWRDSVIAPDKLARGDGDDGSTVDNHADPGPLPRPGGNSATTCGRKSLTSCERNWPQLVAKSSTGCWSF